MEVVVTTGAIRRAKLQSNHDHQQTNMQLVYRQDALPVANQQCNAKAMKGNLAEFLRK